MHHYINKINQYKEVISIKKVQLWNLALLNIVKKTLPRYCPFSSACELSAKKNTPGFLSTLLKSKSGNLKKMT